MLWKRSGGRLAGLSALPLVLASCAQTSAPAQGKDARATPVNVLIEAESDPHGGVLPDAQASRGSYVRTAAAWQPTVAAALPDQGDRFTIWVRYRGESLQLKGVGADGGQREMNWIWDAPKEWKWASFGAHSRAELGSGLLVIRGQDADAHAGVDAIVIADDPKLDPASLTRDTIPQMTVTATVDGARTIAHSTTASFGLNGFHAFDPAVTGAAAYERNMAYMRPGFIRYHNWGMMGDSRKDADGWIDNDRHRWDAGKIRRALAGAYPYGPARLINIPSWPSWMDLDKDDRLDPGQEEAFARFCADLVRIVNKDLKGRVVYWEVTNERDGPYFVDLHENGGWGPLKDAAKPDRVEELARIYVAAARAMKRADPTIKVGGPAVARPDLTAFEERFLKVAAPDLDFYSVHAYASGSAADTDTQIYDRARGFGTTMKSVAELLHRASPKRRIALIFDEYNISWSWEIRDPRMTDNKSAVFDALAMAEAVRGGADITAAWNDCDGVYGKMDGDFHLRPGAHNFHLFNTYLVGDWSDTRSSAPDAVAVYAVRNAANGRRSLLLINRSDAPHPVTLALRNWTYPSGTRLERFEIAATGYSESRLPATALSDGSLSLPENSVTVVTAGR